METYAASRYEGERDLPDLITFAQETTAARAPGASYYHPGDFVWQLCDFDATDDVRIWRGKNDGQIAACAIFEPPLTYEFAILPRGDEERRLLGEIFRWAESRREAAADKTDIPIAYRSRGANTVSTSALATDTARIQGLIDHGYALHEGHSYRNTRPLDAPLPPVELPSGAEFRAVTDNTLEDRAELHRDAWSVWGTSSFTLERYRRLRSSPLYDPDLDVVLSYEGRMVSYCICWIDAANKIGLFEPVGTRPEATRRGFGRAVLHEAFRRLRDRGMTSAVVSTSDVNKPAMALYASVGFEPVGEVQVFVKPDGAG